MQPVYSPAALIIPAQEVCTTSTRQTGGGLKLDQGTIWQLEFVCGFSHQELSQGCGAAVQPSQISDLGIRYGIQIGQAFGFDFGYGIIKDICFVDFVIV